MSRPIHILIVASNAPIECFVSRYFVLIYQIAFPLIESASAIIGNVFAITSSTGLIHLKRAR